MQKVAPRVSGERTPVVVICWHREMPAPTLAAAHPPSSMWTRTGGSCPLSMDVSVLTSAQLFHQCSDGWSGKHIFGKLCKSFCGVAPWGEPCPVKGGTCETCTGPAHCPPTGEAFPFSLQGICWGLCFLTLCPGLAAARPGACQSDGDGALSRVLIVCGPHRGGQEPVTCSGVSTASCWKCTHLSLVPAENTDF